MDVLIGFGDIATVVKTRFCHMAVSTTALLEVVAGLAYLFSGVPPEDACFRERRWPLAKMPFGEKGPRMVAFATELQ